jgi:hypothetical protein
VIARVKIAVLADFKVYANQTIVDEADVLNGDIYAMISPYVTANFWWWPGEYSLVPDSAHELILGLGKV